VPELGTLFCLGIAWIGPEGVWMLTVAIAPLVMLRNELPLSIISLLRGRFSAPA